MLSSKSQTLYVGNTRGNTLPHSTSVSALDAQSGITRWYTLLAPVYPNFSFLQAVHGVVYIAYVTDISTVDALQASDGQLLWRYQGENQRMHTMVVRDDVVYLGISVLPPGSSVLQSKVEALRAADGTLLWRHVSADSSVFDQLVATNALLYLITTKVVNDGLDEGALFPDGVRYEVLDTIHALRAGDGSEVWRAPYQSGALSITAAASSSVLYVLLPVGHYAGYEIHALRASDGVLLWRSQTDVITGISRKAASKDLLYLHQPGRVAAFSTTDGKLRWCSDGDDIYAVSLQTNTDIIYCSGLNRTRSMQQVRALQADNGKELWSVEYPNLGSTIIADDAVVYVASDSYSGGTLYALRKSDGGKLWDRALYQSIFALALEDSG